MRSPPQPTASAFSTYLIPQFPRVPVDAGYLWVVSLSQVCKQLQEIATLQYFAKVEFRSPDTNGWLDITERRFEALSLWQRTGAFMVPRVIWVATSEKTTNHQLRVLGAFFESLQGLEPIHHVYLSLYSSSFGDSPALLSLLQSIQASGCEALFCHSTRHMIAKSTVNDCHTTLICPSNIQVLHIESPLLFAPTCISFTLAALCSAPLRDLTFTNTSLTHNQWSTLL